LINFFIVKKEIRRNGINITMQITKYDNSLFKRLITIAFNRIRIIPNDTNVRIAYIVIPEIDLPWIITFQRGITFDGGDILFFLFGFGLNSISSSKNDIHYDNDLMIIINSLSTPK
ncbi:MAG: hypothetical protein ACMUIG_04180, partial [Thermoplasmatota archaeon]